MLIWCTDLLGPEAMAAEKEERGLSLLFIGYSIDLISNRISISPRNLGRSLYAFLSTNMEADARVACTHLMRLGSLGGRYAQVCPVMNPFVLALYRPTVGLSHTGTTVLSAEVKAVIRLFRCLLVLQHFHGVEFSRPLDSFVRRPHTWILEWDASLEGVGIIGFRVIDGKEVSAFYSRLSLSLRTTLPFRTRPNSWACCLGCWPCRRWVRPGGPRWRVVTP